MGIPALRVFDGIFTQQWRMVSSLWLAHATTKRCVSLKNRIGIDVLVRVLVSCPDSR
jgi:hypothetical protein